MNLDRNPLLHPARRPRRLSPDLRLILWLAGVLASALGAAGMVVVGVTTPRVLFLTVGVSLAAAFWPARDK